MLTRGAFSGPGVSVLAVPEGVAKGFKVVVVVCRMA